MLRRFATALAALLTATGLTAAAPPAAAAATTETSVTLVGNLVAEPWALRLTPDNAHFTTFTAPGWVKLWVDVEGGDRYTVELGAPVGQPLAVGTYDHVAHFGNDRPGVPGLSVSGQGSTCGRVTGRFRVLDVGFDDAGHVNRLWATYVHHCGVSYAALVGEIRLNLPAGATTVANGALDFADTYPELTRSASVWLTNNAADPLRVEGFGLSGAGKEAYRVAATDCSTLRQGETCQALVTFRPGAQGEVYPATLTFDTGGGTGPAAALGGRAIPGRTSFTVDSDEGDYVGNGGTYSYTQTSASFAAAMPLEDGRKLAFGVEQQTPRESWAVQLWVPPGQTITAGTTYTDPGDEAADEPSLVVTGLGRGCNMSAGTMRVLDVEYVPNGLEVLRLVATFDHHCVGSAAHLRGTIEWRAPSTVPPPDVTAPGPVGGLTATPGVLSAALDWSPPADPDVARYVVRKKAGTSPPSAHTSGTWVYSGPATEATATGLEPATTYTFAVYAMDASGNVSSPAVRTLYGSALTAGVTPGTMTYGSPVTVAVRLVDVTTGQGLPGQPVDVLFQAAGTSTWRRVATVTSAPDGTAALRSYPRTNGTYAATFRGAGPHLGTTAAGVPVGVRTRVSAALSRTSLYGSVAPAHPGRWVYLQRYVSGTWRTVAHAVLTSDSRYAFRLPATRGTYVYRVVRPADADHLAGYSATRTLRVT